MPLCESLTIKELQKNANQVLIRIKIHQEKTFMNKVSFPFLQTLLSGIT